LQVYCYLSAYDTSLWSASWVQRGLIIHNRIKMLTAWNIKIIQSGFKLTTNLVILPKIV
jgi:hypothetical protein